MPAECPDCGSTGANNLTVTDNTENGNEAYVECSCGNSFRYVYNSGRSYNPGESSEENSDSSE